MVWHFGKVVRGLPDPRRSRRCRATTSKDIPVADQVNGAGFRPDEIAKLPVPGPFKYESVTPQAELRLARERQLREPPHRQAGQPRLSRVQVVRRSGRDDRGLPEQRDRRRVRPPGLGPPEGPGSRRPGRGDPGPPVRVPAPELVARPVHDGRPEQEHRWLLAQRRRSRTAARAARQPTRRSARPSPTRSTRTRSTRGSSAATPRSRTRTSARRRGSTRTSRRRPSTRTRPSRSSPTAAGPTPTATASSRRTALKAKIELCTTTRQVRQDTLALISAWLKNVGIDSVINPVAPSDIFADYNEATNDTPCALARSNFDLAEHAFSSSIDPLGNYSSYHSSQFRPTGANDAQVSDPDVDKALDDVKNNVDFAVDQGRHGAPSRRLYVDKTVEIPLYYRKNVELANPRVGNYFANGTQVGSDLERRGLVRQPVGRGFTLRRELNGAPGDPGAPSTRPSGDGRRGCTVRASRPIGACPAGTSRIQPPCSGLRPNADDQIRDPSRAPGDPGPVRDHHRRVRDPARRARRSRRRSSPTTRR